MPSTIDVIEHALFPSAPPVRIGRFEVRRQLGRGGMGVVYLARDPDLKREVAIKVHRGRRSAAARGKLKAEAEALARVRHRNVVTVFEVGRTEEDDVYVVMEYLRGPMLRAWLEDAPSVGACLEMFVRCARGLHAAHRESLAHGDFKPANVVIDDDGEPRIIDFGLAHASDDAAGGDVLGTKRYLAPELWAGRSPSMASDQFAFGTSLYESLTGEPPWTDDARRQPAVPPKTLRGPVWTVVQRMLDADPERRFPSMHAVATALEDCLRRQRRGRWLPASIVAASVLVGGAAVAALALEPTTPQPCAFGVELLAEGTGWSFDGDRGARRDGGLELNISPEDSTFTRAVLDGEALTFHDRALVFKLSQIPQADTSNEVLLGLRESDDDLLAILIYGGRWVFPMAANTHDLSIEIDREQDLWFRIQIEDQVSWPDLITFEFSSDGRTWTPIARVEHTVKAPRLVVELGSHPVVDVTDHVRLESIVCAPLEPAAPMSAQRDRARVE